MPQPETSYLQTTEAVLHLNMLIHRQRIAELDYRRTSLNIIKSQINIAQLTPPITEGFSRAGPYEICQRYAIGEITRTQLINELTRWHYPPKARPEHELDDLLIDPPGTWAEVEDANLDYLIDDDLYEELMELTNDAETQDTDPLTTQPPQGHP